MVEATSNAILDEDNVSDDDDDDIYDYDFTEDANGSDGEDEEFYENDHSTDETTDRQYDAADVENCT